MSSPSGMWCAAPPTAASRHDRVLVVRAVHVPKEKVRMRTSRRALIALVATMATAGALTACSSGGNSDSATGTITYFTFSAAPDHLQDLDAIKSAFEADNP